MRYSMHKVWVRSMNIPKPTWSVWATFALAVDAHAFMEQTKKANPTWEMRVEYPE